MKFLLHVTKLNGNQCSKCSYSWFYLSINILSYFHEYEEIVHTEQETINQLLGAPLFKNQKGGMETMYGAYFVLF